MRLLPCYKNLHINSSDKRMIYAQLDQLQFGYNPFYFILTESNKDHEETVKAIEDYLLENQINFHPYPFYIIGNVKYYEGPLKIIPNKSYLPKFYNRKPRPLSSKENLVMNKLELKQTSVKNYADREVSPILFEYARAHKSIVYLKKELDFLEQLNQRLLEDDR